MTGQPPDGRAQPPAAAPRGARAALRVVALGGGHGLGASLGALCRAVPDSGGAELTAIVTVADNGGSSGRLRSEFPTALPPGDLRMALAALCLDANPWKSLLQHRFSSSGPLDGHAVGNLVLLAAWEQTHDPVSALALVGDLVGSRGRVLPMSAVPLGISAEVEFAGGGRGWLSGQAAVAKPAGRILHLRLEPEDPPACAQAVQAIVDADAVLLGPGSWFTSVLVHLLVPGLADALVRTTARLLVALNLSSDRETDGLGAADQLSLLHSFAPGIRIHAVLADRAVAAATPDLRAAAARLGARPVVADLARRDRSGRPTAEHDRDAFAAALLPLLTARDPNAPEGRVAGSNACQ